MELPNTSLMKQKILHCLLLFSFLCLKTQAQSSFQYNRFDSIPLQQTRLVCQWNKETYFYEYNQSNVLGLYKYDTVQKAMVAVHHPNESDYIVSMAVDSNNNLLVLNEYALQVYNGTQWQVYHAGNAAYFNNMVVDANNKVYIQTGYDSVYIFSNNSWQRFLPFFVHANEKVQQLTCGTHHECVAITTFNQSFSSGEYYFNNQTAVPVSLSLPYLVTGGIMIDRHNKLWYSYKDSIITIDSASNVGVINYLNSPIQIGNNYSNFIINESGTKLWLVANNNRTLYFRNNNQWDSITNLYSYSCFGYLGNDKIIIQNYNWTSNSPDYTYKIYHDNLLTAKYNNALNQHVGKVHNVAVSNYQWNIYFQGFISSDDGILDATGKKIFDTSNTALTTNKINWITYNNTSRRKSEQQWWGGNLIDTVFIGTDKGLFVGVFNNNYSALTIIQHYTRAAGFLTSDTVLCVTTKNDYYNNNTVIQLWVGTDKGLTMIDRVNNQAQFYTTSNSNLPTNYCRKVIVPIFDTTIYVCTDSGLFYINNNLIRVYNTANSGIGSNNVQDVFDYNTGIIVSTLGSGYCIKENFWQPCKSLTNSSFLSDSVYFYFNSNQYDLGVSVGTKDAGFITDLSGIGNNFTQYLSMDNQPINNFFDYDYTFIPCEGGGFNYAALSDKGVITKGACYGGIQGIQPTTDNYNNWLNGNELHIRWNALQNGEATIQLYDLLGRKLMETTTEVNNQQCLTYLSDFPAALYLIKVSQKNSQHGGKLLWMKN